jgi:hypothetical protein
MCTATTPTGAVQPSGCIPVSLGCHSVGAAGPSNRVWLQEWLFWLCRRKALHWASQNGHTETAMALVKADADVQCKDTDGYGSSGCILVSLGCHSAGAAGLSSRVGAAGVAALAVQPDGAARCVAARPDGDGDCVWLFRDTALHDASYNGHTETTMALVKVGADVHCKDNDGYGSSGYLGELREGLCATGK